MCLPELLMDAEIIKGDTVKLSVISAATVPLFTVSAVRHWLCDVMFSCHVIGPQIKEVADKEHNGLDCVAEERSELRAVSEKQKKEKKKEDFDLSLNHV